MDRLGRFLVQIVGMQFHCNLDSLGHLSCGAFFLTEEELNQGLSKLNYDVQPYLSYVDIIFVSYLLSEARFSK